MHQLRRILVGIELDHDPDHSQVVTSASLDAWQQALWLAEQNEGQICLLHVIEDQPPENEEEAAACRVREHTESVLQQLVESASQREIDVTTKIDYGSAWIRLTQEVLRGHHQLLIIGTRGRRRLTGWLFGSTATRLLRTCPVPLWVTKGPMERDEPPDVLIAADLRDSVVQTIHTGVDVAQLLDAKLHVLHSIEHHTDLRLRYSDTPDEEVRRRREEKMQAAESRLHDIISTTDHRTLTWGTQMHLVGGPADREILSAVKEFDVELLVLGTQTRTGMSAWLLGNTTERLLRDVNCSVLAVKSDGFVSPVTLDD